jgi:G3E family GTPase
MNSGCICCSLVGDFGTALKEVMQKFTPDRIVIEPSGVGKLSDVVRAVEKADLGDGVTLNSAVTVVDAKKAKLYVKNFGEFFNNQVEHAGTIILSRTADIADDKLKTAVDLLREHNAKATIITTPWEQLTGESIRETMEGVDLMDTLLKEVIEEQEHHHHHHDGEECDDPECECHHHDDDDHDGHEHHHHDHEEHHHHHHHDGEECDDPECECHHHHDNDHHHHHHADDVFGSWGMETPAKYTKEEIEEMLAKLIDAVTYGTVLRAKGMVPAQDGGWIYFDYVPGESNVREGAPQPTGKFCVIGSKLNEEELKELFAK